MSEHDHHSTHDPDDLDELPTIADTSVPTEFHDPSGASTLDGGLTESCGAVIGKFTLVEKLGEGGFGSVWAADQSEPIRRRVALKIIKLGMDTRQVINRFEAERQALAVMNHPGIAKVLDAGATETGRPYFVMELVEGLPITSYCDREKLSIEERLELFVKVCQAVQHAHQKGIIHRDIKPSNILVARHDPDSPGEPKVIDFGIAKATQQSLSEQTIFTQAGQFIGTPAYMSPEQADGTGLDIDTRSDLYSLGVLLYELLTGVPPFNWREVMSAGMEVVRKTIREEDPPRPSTRLASVDAQTSTVIAKCRSEETGRLFHRLKGDLDWVVMKCLEKDRSRRYDSANAIIEDLRRHRNDEPITARPPSAGYRLRKAWRRNKVLYSAGTAVMIALVAGTVVSAWQAAVARSALRKSKAGEYAARMNLTMQAWELGRVGQIREVLNATRGFPARGFEWDYFQNLIHQDIRTFESNGASTWLAAFAPDGTWVACAQENSIVLAESESGEILKRLAGPSDVISALAVSHSGERVLAGGWNGSLTLSDTATGDVTASLQPSSSRVQQVLFSPDDSVALATFMDGAAVLWNVSSGRQQATLGGNKSWIVRAAFSPDGTRLLTGSWDRSIRVWDVATGAALFVLDDPSRAVSDVAWLPDGDRFAIASGATVTLRDAQSGDEVMSLIGHQGGVGAIDVSPDGLRIASGGGDRTARIWDTQTGAEVQRLVGHTGYLTAVGFSADGAQLITASQDQSVRIWDTVNGRQLGAFRGHIDEVLAAEFSPNGTRVITTSLDRTVKLWNTSTAGSGSGYQSPTGQILVVEPDKTGRRILVCTGGKSVVVLDADSLRVVLELNDHARSVWHASFSNDGERIVTAGLDHVATVWDARSGEKLFTLTGHEDRLNYAVFSPDDSKVITASKDQTVRIWDAASRALTTVIADLGSEVNCARMTRDGNRVFIGLNGSGSGVWRIADGKPEFQFDEAIGGVFNVGFDRDGGRLVTGDSDGSARVWDAGTGELLLTLAGHDGIVRSAAFSPDAQRIVTANEDQTLKLWDLDYGWELLTLKGHDNLVWTAQFSPDGSRIYSGGDDGVLRTWVTADAEHP